MKTKYLVFILVIFLSIQSVFAWTEWSTNKFNNSLTIENMTINITNLRWLDVPNGTILTRAYMNLTGFSSIAVKEFGGDVRKLPTNGNVPVTPWRNNSHPYGVAYNGSNFAVVDGYDKIVYIYDSNGVWIKNWTLAVGNTNPYGIDNDGSNWFVTDNGNKNIYRYDLNGVYIDNFYRSSGDNMVDTANNGTHIWIANKNFIELVLMNGTYVKTVNTGVFSSGIAVDDENNLYISSYTQDKVLKYNSNLINVANFTLNSTNSNHYGLHLYEDSIYTAEFQPTVYSGIFEYSLGTGSYPTGVNIKVGTTNYNLGTITDTITSTNLYNSINSVTSSCSCGNCSFSNGNCSVPFLFYSSGSGGILRYSDLVFNNVGYIESGQFYNTTTYETATENFVLNITSSIDTARLIYNGNSYPGTKSGTGDFVLFSKSLIINSSMVGNNPFYWVINESGVESNLSTYYQNVSAINFSTCDSEDKTRFLILRFKDEDTLEYINASISSSTFYYYYGDGSLKKSYTYTNNTNNNQYDFCGSPNISFKVEPTIQYKQGTAYPQRIWNPGVQTYSNSTTNQILYLLGSGGDYITFQVVAPTGQTLEDVSVVVTRVIGSSVVSSGSTGSAGTVTFFLNPDYEYQLVFSKTGYATETFSVYPTASEYTITMGSVTESQIEDYSKGVYIRIYPNASGTLYNDTTYEFKMVMNSSYYTIQNYGFVLKLNNGTILGSSSSTGNGETTLNLNTKSYSTIYMYYNWTINDSTSVRITSWNIKSNKYTRWSIKYFVDDLKNYLATDMFGIDEFGRNLIIYIILFLAVGIFSYKYGMSNPIVLSMLVFAIVYMFDVSLGLLTNPISAIPNLFTWLAGLVMIVAIIREVMV